MTFYIRVEDVDRIVRTTNIKGINWWDASGFQNLNVIFYIQIYGGSSPSLAPGKASFKDAVAEWFGQYVKMKFISVNLIFYKILRIL